MATKAATQAIISNWARTEGSPVPLGVTWIPEEKAYNFSIYSKYADRVTLLLYSPADLRTPNFTYDFNPFKNRTGRVWHARIPAAKFPDVRYYAYSMDGPPPNGNFERHAFKPAKILLDPCAALIFVPSSYDRAAACGAASKPGRRFLGFCRRKTNRPSTGATTSAPGTMAIWSSTRCMFEDSPTTPTRPLPPQSVAPSPAS